MLAAFYLPLCAAIFFWETFEVYRHLQLVCGVWYLCIYLLKIARFCCWRRPLSLHPDNKIYYKASVHSCVHACIHLRVHAYTALYIHLTAQAYTPLCMHAPQCACVHPTVYGCIHPTVHAYTPVCMHTPQFACIHRRVYTPRLSLGYFLSVFVC